MAHTAVGAIFMSVKTGRVLLNLRSETVTYANYWGFVGGKVEAGERPVEALEREIREELGDHVPTLEDIIPFDVFVNKNRNFCYYSFLVFVDDEFVPDLNEESSGYAWIKLRIWPKPLHPGAKATLYDENIIHDFEQLWEQKKTGRLLTNSLPT